MAEPALAPLGPLWPERPPRVLITLSPAPAREAADSYVRTSGGVAGKPVVVDCRRHYIVYEVFGYQLVRRLFEQGAEAIQFVQPSPELWDLVCRVAARIGKSDRVTRENVEALWGLLPQFSDAPPPSSP